MNKIKDCVDVFCRKIASLSTRTKLILVILILLLLLPFPVAGKKITYKMEDERVIVIDYKNARTIWNYLRKKLHCTRAAAAGVLGNMFAESEYHPDIVESNEVGHGIGQWSWERWYGEDGLYAYAENHGKNWDDMKLQLDFLRHEIVENDSMSVYYEGGFRKFRKLKKIEGEEGSVLAFFCSFEYGNWISYEDFVSDLFESNFATRSKRLAVAKKIFKDRIRFP